MFPFKRKQAVYTHIARRNRDLGTLVLAGGTIGVMIYGMFVL